MWLRRGFAPDPCGGLPWRCINLGGSCRAPGLASSPLLDAWNRMRSIAGLRQFARRVLRLSSGRTSLLARGILRETQRDVRMICAVFLNAATSTRYFARGADL